MTMLSVEDALRTIRDNAATLEAETIHLEMAGGRVVAGDIVAQISQPPFAASAMDGYAARLQDVRAVGARLRVIGEARAGASGGQTVEPGTAVRIFTGGVLPSAADHVIIQEEVDRDGDFITLTSAQISHQNIRRAGLDFEKGAVLKKAGSRLSAIDLSLLAAANIASASVARRPVVAYFDNGDELVDPGAPLASGKIVGSNRYALGELIKEWGGDARYLGRASDDPSSIRTLIERARDADVLVPIGGASVGEHDHARAVFSQAGGKLIFEKIAVRPGKPTWFGALDKTLVLGLPGNPASAIVCAALFLRPLIGKMLAADDSYGKRVKAVLDGSLSANGPRETYLRGKARYDDKARLTVAPSADQDSSLLGVLAAADVLMRRPPHAPAAERGDLVECILIRPAE
ncbi:MAG: molybdopterin molybdotransferase MoeA [Amphiplicatus sp.]